MLQGVVSADPRANGAAGHQLLTVREVAERLRVCTATVYKLCQAGELGHVRVSNAVRVPETALRAFTESSKRCPKRPRSVAV